tara:strand:- start:790 stop:1182 length:393 start_codon:yes stop_codon:yes gene_type:complete
MTETQAIEYIREIISDTKGSDYEDITDCAGSLCIIDISNFGLEDWLSWTPEEIVTLFIEVMDSTMTELLDELKSNYAGEQLIDELLGSDQTQRVDHDRAVNGVKDGAVKMMQTLRMYLKIKRDISCFIHN